MEPTQPGATEEEAAVGILAVMEEQDKNPPPPTPESLAKKAEEPAEEEEEATEEAQPEEEAESVELDMDAPMFEVKVQGEVKKVSANELTKSFMMESDYRQKTAEVARQREEVQSQIRQGVEGERKQYMEALQMQQKLLWNAVAPELQKVDMDKLADEDPAEFVKVQNRINRFNHVIQSIQAEQQKIQQQEQEHFKNVILPKEQDALQRDIPNWGQEVQTSLVKTGMERYGFSREELAGLYDSRMIKVLHDAHQYHLSKQQTQQAKEVAQKKVVAKPKVLKPGSKQPAQPSGDDLKRLQKTGKIEDAAQAIFNRL